MTDSAPESQTGKTWLSVAGAGAVIGAAAAVAFAVIWFEHTAESCGVVRFYEHLVGGVVLGGWLAGTVAGLLVAFKGRRGNPKAVKIGSIITLVTCLVMAIACVKTIHDFREADYSLKSTETLLKSLAGNNLDARILAANALGERRAAEALLRLCAVLDDAREDVNLRHNAAIALGKICAPPRTAEVDVDRAVSSLIRALEGRDEFLPHSIAEALGRIGDQRAVAPLAAFLTDASRPVHSREYAARALGRIGGAEARAALERARADCRDEDLASGIGRVLNEMARPKTGVRGD